ncbi:MAG: VWA domain-containing protein [Vicinamibacteria bacterium]
MTFSLRADRRLVRAGARSRRFLRVEIEAPRVARAGGGRLPVNLAFVVDRSGSMEGEKIERARDAAIQGIRALSPEDRFAVVAYDHEVEVVVLSAPATDEAKAEAERRVRQIEARGSTNLHGGWERGCREIQGGLAGTDVARCLLLTDGRANAGVQDHGDVLGRVAAMRRQRVATSAFGIGRDFDEVFLAGIAEAGGGNFHFVETAAQIPTFLEGEVGEALAVTARDAVLVIDAGEGAAVASLNDFPCARKEDGLWRVELGSLVSGQRLDPIVGVTFPEGEPRVVRDVKVRLEDADGAFGRAAQGLSFTYAGHAENDRQDRDRVVDRRVAALYAARVSRQALERNRAGDLGEARRLLALCRERILRYAGDDPELRRIAGDLHDKIERHRAPIDDVATKTLFFSETMALKARPAPAAARPAPSSRSLNMAVAAPAELAPIVRRALEHLTAAEPELFGGVELEAGETAEAEATLAAGAEISMVAKGAPLPPMPGGPLRVVFTTRRLGDASPFHWHGLHRTAVVSLADWRDTPVAEAVAAYEIALHSLRAMARGFDPGALFHVDPRDCFFDIADTPPEVERRLAAGGLCPACALALASSGIAAATVLALARTVKLLASPPTAVH